MNLKAKVARELLIGRPESVFRRVALNSTFRVATSLDLQAGAYGIPRGELQAASQLAVQGQEVSVEDRSGNFVDIYLEGNRLFMRKNIDGKIETRTAPDDLQLLSPDATIRKEAFLKLVAYFGATGPKSSDWLLRLEARQVTLEELDVLYGQMRSSLNQWRGWITEKIDSQRAQIGDLTPNELSYFSSLCGPPPGDMLPEEWIVGPLAEHRRHLVSTDLVSGLAAILPSSIRDDLGPAALIVEIDDKTVLAAIEALPNFIDPFSLLGLLDIALSRQDGHASFKDMAEMLVLRLLADPFRRPDGMDLSRFYPGLVTICLKNMRRTEGLAATAPSWQRLCAFNHAGHLLEIFGRLDFDVDAITEALPLEATSFDNLGEYLNCRTAPMWMASKLNGNWIRTEIIARLEILRRREIAAGRAFPKEDMVAAAYDQAGIAAMQAGPLEGHKRPTSPERAIPKEAEGDIIETLVSDPKAGSDHVLILASICSLGENLSSEIVSMIPNIPLKGEDPRDALKPLIYFALTASMQANCAISNAVTERCLQDARSLVIADHGLERADILFRTILIASTAQPEWTTWLATKLVSLALAMPSGPWHGQIEFQMEQMKQLLPLAEWQFGRATAYARLGHKA